ncbi:IclR family transcriptional regulator domain-containing protein [Rhodovulum sulfidophilum]|uniref:IclR family transcriptional regulator domain-containing protein n=1 Tax=Rhodovulum sulfidophilum TaxID=35806 RepID=UPI001920C254|nr:IclR family transcriptional regulator C-terminal domain-containing protein [Rhodovulum sulfidophilum]MBL3560604.1 helix-turn-helix domain-containing protein [Rhodovulum sulfidophilum]
MSAKHEDAEAGSDLRRSDFVSAVGRAMSVLECFTSDEAIRQRGRLTLTDAAKLTDLSRGTARRLLLTLAEIHYVDTDGKFFWLTPKLVNLSRGFLMPLGVGEGSAAILKELTGKLDESASVGILDGEDIVYIERVEVRRIYSSRIVNGTRLPAACSSIGRVLLASLSDSDLHNWMRSYPLRRLTEKTITDPDAFWDEIRAIRIRGYAIIDEELEIGIRSIAVPIQSPNGRTMAALNGSTISARHSVEDLREAFLPELLDASRKLSGTMGW